MLDALALRKHARPPHRLRIRTPLGQQKQAEHCRPGCQGRRPRSSLQPDRGFRCPIRMRQFGGAWETPGTTEFSSEGYSFTITAGPQDSSCYSVSYIGTDDATYGLTVFFAASGAAIAPGTGSAAESESTRGYYPEQSAGKTSQPPGQLVKHSADLPSAELTYEARNGRRVPRRA